MEVSAKLTGSQISAQKVRLVADQIRGKAAEEALDIRDQQDVVLAGDGLKPQS